MQALEVDSGGLIKAGASQPSRTIAIPRTHFRCLYGSLMVLIIVLIVVLATRSGSTSCDHLHGESCDNIKETSSTLPDSIKLKSVLDGTLCTEGFRIKFVDSKDRAASPWHHPPLKMTIAQDDADDKFNMVVEIPKNSKRKWEINTKETNNPIAQDVKDGKLREYPGPIYWNYGALPRTYEAPDVKLKGSQLDLADAADTEFIGDGDPLDVVEIGSKTFPVGTIVGVKVLGILAMIDSGEVDWKLIAIDAGDDRAADLTLENIDEKMPGVVSGILEWFRWYKTPDGKKLNVFGNGGKPYDKAKAVEVITETHGHWMKLVKGEWGDDKSKSMWVPKIESWDPEKTDQLQAA